MDFVNRDLVYISGAQRGSVRSGQLISQVRYKTVQLCTLHPVRSSQIRRISSSTLPHIVEDYTKIKQVRSPGQRTKDE